MDDTNCVFSSLSDFEERTEVATRTLIVDTIHPTLMLCLLKSMCSTLKVAEISYIELTYEMARTMLEYFASIDVLDYVNLYNIEIPRDLRFVKCYYIIIVDGIFLIHKLQYGIYVISKSIFITNAKYI